MTDARRPVHLAVLLGVCTGTYAVALAGVTALQSVADQAVIADRAPAVDAAHAAATAHDGLEAGLDDAARRFRALAARYDELGQRIGSYETALDALAARTDAITESVAALPSRIQLPSPPSIPAAVPRTRPTVHATTGASG